MKTTLETSYVPVDSESIKALVSEVKETIAMDATGAKKGSLKVVDLWNIERNRKSATRTFAHRRNPIRFI